MGNNESKGNLTDGKQKLFMNISPSPLGPMVANGKRPEYRMNPVQMPGPRADVVARQAGGHRQPNSDSENEQADRAGTSLARGPSETSLKHQQLQRRQEHQPQACPSPLDQSPMTAVGPGVDDLLRSGPSQPTAAAGPLHSLEPQEISLNPQFDPRQCLPSSSATRVIGPPGDGVREITFYHVPGTGNGSFSGNNGRHVKLPVQISPYREASSGMDVTENMRFVEASDLPESEQSYVRQSRPTVNADIDCQRVKGAGQVSIRFGNIEVPKSHIEVAITCTTHRATSDRRGSLRSTISHANVSNDFSSDTNNESAPFSVNHSGNFPGGQGEGQHLSLQPSQYSMCFGSGAFSLPTGQRLMPSQADVLLSQDFVSDRTSSFHAASCEQLESWTSGELVPEGECAALPGMPLFSSLESPDLDSRPHPALGHAQYFQPEMADGSACEELVWSDMEEGQLNPTHAESLPPAAELTNSSCSLGHSTRTNSGDSSGSLDGPCSQNSHLAFNDSTCPGINTQTNTQSNTQTNTQTNTPDCGQAACISQCSTGAHQYGGLGPEPYPNISHSQQLAYGTIRGYDTGEYDDKEEDVAVVREQLIKLNEGLSQNDEIYQILTLRRPGGADSFRNTQPVARSKSASLNSQHLRDHLPDTDMEMDEIHPGTTIAVPADGDNCSPDVGGTPHPGTAMIPAGSSSTGTDCRLRRCNAGPRRKGQPRSGRSRSSLPSRPDRGRMEERADHEVEEVDRGKEREKDKAKEELWSHTPMRTLPVQHMNFVAYLCCAPEDLEMFGLSFHHMLESWGCRIFIADRDLQLTGPKYENMANWLENRCNGKIIVVLSKNYHNSEECLFLTYFAKTLDPDAKQRNIIPVQIDKEVEFLSVLRGVSIIQYNHAKRNGWLKNKLVEAIAA